MGFSVIAGQLFPVVLRWVNIITQVLVLNTCTGYCLCCPTATPTPMGTASDLYMYFITVLIHLHSALCRLFVIVSSIFTTNFLALLWTLVVNSCYCRSKIARYIDHSVYISWMLHYESNTVASVFQVCLLLVELSN